MYNTISRGFFFFFLVAILHYPLLKTFGYWCAAILRESKPCLSPRGQTEWTKSVMGLVHLTS